MPIKDLEARRAYAREWAMERRREQMEGRSCEWCGSTEDLEFHHRDPSQKVAHKFRTWSRERAAVEIAKCIVLCSDCHHRGHAEARRVEAELRNPHGTERRYRLGCKCAPCRSAHSEHTQLKKKEARDDAVAA